MSLTYKEIVSEAMKLAAKERADLADTLWISVDTPEAVAAAWDEEIKRRLAQLEAGEVEAIAVESVIAELRAKLR
jgi:putative addiction module component (TIGR02574 family)